MHDTCTSVAYLPVYILACAYTSFIRKYLLQQFCDSENLEVPMYIVFLHSVLWIEFTFLNFQIYGI